ncbi:MAG: membrane protein insertase YidC [Moheibacter sp.]
MQQEKKPDNNTFIAMLLMGALLLGYFYINKPSEEELQEKQRQEQIDAKKSDDGKKDLAQVQQEQSVQSPADSTFTVAKAEDYQLESPKFNLKFSGKGGHISELELKGYTAYSKKSKDNKKPLFLINEGNNQFNLELSGKDGKTINTSELSFAPTVQKHDSVTVVTMTAPVSGGGRLDYVYTVGNDYTVGFEIKSSGIHELTSSKDLKLDWKLKAGSIEKGKQQEGYWSQTYYRFKGTDKVEYELFGSDKWNEDKSIDWIAFKKQFFSSILSFDEGFPNPVGGSEQIDEKVDSLHSRDYHFTSVLPIAGSELNYKMQWDFVPLDYKILTEPQYKGKDFDEIIPFGWSLLGWINRHFFLVIFSWLAKMGMTYGWVIFLMTIIVKLVLSPIMYKQYRQSAMMRVLRPEINEINEKFKGKENAVKRQQATMELYRKAGANPLSGCLPALIQLPIFYALFRFFPNVINLRGQSFLWADDLTAYDSAVLLPDWIPFMNGHLSIFALAYIIAMVIYFKISGSMDSFNQPPQEGMPDMRMMKYMMYLMPIFFFVFLNNYASGLSWYYLVSNVINIGIVLVIKNVLINDEKIHAKIQENKAKPKKQSKWSKKMQELMTQAQEQQKLQEQRKKGKK